MDRMIYTAMSGAQRTLEQQSVINNNLANVSTDGFRKELAIYRSVPVNSPDTAPTRVATVTSTPGSDFTEGALQQTQRPLDLAIRGPGWFAVRSPRGGEAYTRSGSLTVDRRGLLVTTQGGLPVLSDKGTPIEVPDNATLTFSNDGTITSLGPGDQPSDIDNLGSLKLVNPPVNSLRRGDDGLFRVGPGNGIPARDDPTVRIASGFVEKSNVSPAKAMVGMINNARRYEMQMQIISDASDNEERANSILAPGS
jgi:flagellar basal-body rod protein FlgF